MRTLVFLLCSLAMTHAATVMLAWDPNPEPDVAGYRIYYGSPPGNYTVVKDCGNVTNTVIEALEPGRTYAFYATCYNTSALESEPSNVVTYTVPAPRPQRHRNLTAAIRRSIRTAFPRHTATSWLSDRLNRLIAGILPS